MPTATFEITSIWSRQVSLKQNWQDLPEDNLNENPSLLYCEIRRVTPKCTCTQMVCQRFQQQICFTPWFNLAGSWSRTYFFVGNHKEMQVRKRSQEVIKHVVLDSYTVLGLCRCASNKLLRQGLGHTKKSRAPKSWDTLDINRTNWQVRNATKHVWACAYTTWRWHHSWQFSTGKPRNDKV